MRKIIFLNKLKRVKKLILVKPSLEIKESYIKKSESSLDSAKILLKSEKLEESIALTYYSMYHVVTALLFSTGIKCENHSASIILMREIFELDNTQIMKAKAERVDKQYYTDFHITKEDVIEAIKNAEIFNSELLDFIAKLIKKDIEHFRDKFINL
ncbi:HEPN domain-containing protein [Nanoarchaeota archaeon]